MSFISKWKEKIAHYLEVHINLFKLGLIERASHLMSYFILVFIVLFLSACILIFVGISIAEYFHEIVGFSKHAGFLITGGIYFLLMIFLFLGKRKIINAFSGVIIKILTESEEDEHDDTNKDKANDDKMD